MSVKIELDTAVTSSLCSSPSLTVDDLDAGIPLIILRLNESTDVVEAELPREAALRKVEISYSGSSLELLQPRSGSLDELVLGQVQLLERRRLDNGREYFAVVLADASVRQTELHQLEVISDALVFH